MVGSNVEINKRLLKLTKRAETSDRSQLVSTFVDQGFLFALLSRPEHQIIYGRRGTGKTHALLYLADQVSSQDGDVPVFVDLRSIGSSGGIYSDANVPIAERATRLLVDTLSAVHEEVLRFIVHREQEDLNLAVIGPLLDRFADAVTKVEVHGQVELETHNSSTAQQNNSDSLGFSMSPQTPFIRGETQTGRMDSAATENRIKAIGTPTHKVNFGELYQILSNLVRSLSGRLWILLDEWSAVPIDLQPYLADLLRRALFPIQGLVVKISAIEQRSHFRILGHQGSYIGIELGADASADLNLDDFMVFDNNQEAARIFFQEMLFKHYRHSNSTDNNAYLIESSKDFVKLAFSQENTFGEFVRAVEGVPRDALNIITVAAQKAGNSAISVAHVREAASTWYTRDKESAVMASPDARGLLHWIIDNVIGHRRARAFLLRSDERHELINALFDSRVLHLLKRNISTHDHPGVRYDVYKMDYGGYVNLINTSKNPLGLIPTDDGSYFQVPPDDYRAIRRAILDLTPYYARLNLSVKHIVESPDK